MTLRAEDSLILAAMAYYLWPNDKKPTYDRDIITDSLPHMIERFSGAVGRQQ